MTNNNYAVDSIAIERRDQIKKHGHSRANDIGHSEELIEKALVKIYAAFDILVVSDDEVSSEKFLIEAGALCAAAVDSLEKNNE